MPIAMQPMPYPVDAVAGISGEEGPRCERSCVGEDGALALGGRARASWSAHHAALSGSAATASMATLIATSAAAQTTPQACR